MPVPLGPHLARHLTRGVAANRFKAVECLVTNLFRAFSFDVHVGRHSRVCQLLLESVLYKQVTGILKISLSFCRGVASSV